MDFAIFYFKRKHFFSVAVIFIFIFFSCMIFGPTLFQEGNPLPILQGIIRLQLVDDNVVQISKNTERYMTKTESGEEAFIVFMKSKGFTFKEQFGAGFVFEKQGDSITVLCRSYSRYFKIWNKPSL